MTQMAQYSIEQALNLVNTAKVKSKSNYFLLFCFTNI